MAENKIADKIKKLVTSLLENSTNNVKIEEILNKIHTHFQKQTEITGFDFNVEYLAAVPTAKGKALGLNHAAQCLLDYKRTVKFLQAFILAIKEKQKNNPEKTIHILYAGCGPYAPFVTLVAPFFSEKEIQFTLLEINKSSLKSAKKLINSLELTNYIQEYYLADAVTFVVPNAKKFHILFSETLDALLYRECYVPILFNLLPQFHKEITLIPENVILSLKLLNKSNQKTDFNEFNLGEILNVSEAISANKKNIKIPSKLPDKKIDLESLKINQHSSFIIDTNVHIYDNFWLHRNESSLTLPFEIKLEQPFFNKGIIFTYQMDPEIELKCRFE